MTGSASTDPGLFSDSDLAALERRYTPPGEQECVVCGAPLTSVSGDCRGSLYACSSDDASPLRSTRPLQERLVHWSRSEWHDNGQTDAAVARLIRAYRELAAAHPQGLKTIQKDDLVVIIPELGQQRVMRVSHVERDIITVTDVPEWSPDE